MKSSPLFSLNKYDLLKGLLMAILTPAIVVIEQSVNAGSLHLDWHSISLAAVGGGLAYLLKNFLTPAEKPKAEETK